ncbi:MAG: hypothetical protein U1E26_09045 [Coriobacteriia bacterium]|nr:hypothetical protein [Coriobacteriia bacterium]
MTDYTPKPAQFRLPPWAHEFLVQETAERGVTKTDVVLEALEQYKRTRFEELMKQGYLEMADEHREECRIWDATLLDGAESDEW